MCLGYQVGKPVRAINMSSLDPATLNLWQPGIIFLNMLCFWEYSSVLLTFASVFSQTRGLKVVWFHGPDLDFRAPCRLDLDPPGAAVAQGAAGANTAIACPVVTKMSLH